MEAADGFVPFYYEVIEVTFSTLIRDCLVASRYLQQCLTLQCLMLSAAVAALVGLKPFVLPFPLLDVTVIEVQIPCEKTSNNTHGIEKSLCHVVLHSFILNLPPSY